MVRCFFSWVDMQARTLSALILAGLLFSHPLAHGEDALTTISPFSGKPVPRFETLRYSEVRGRTGPGLKYSVSWMYEREGLPMLILKESHDWRRVRDPDGDEVWMHKQMLSSRQGVFTLGETPLYAEPRQDNEAISTLASGVLASVLIEDDAWLKVDVQGHRGWVRADGLWGVRPPPARP